MSFSDRYEQRGPTLGEVYRVAREQRDRQIELFDSAMFKLRNADLPDAYAQMFATRQKLIDGVTPEDLDTQLYTAEHVDELLETSRLLRKLAE